jgi:hypothetical protein
MVTQIMHEELLTAASSLTAGEELRYNAVKCQQAKKQGRDGPNLAVITL